jgi:hypothetical protein
VDYFVALVRLQPLVMLLEDAHWIDPTTRDLVDALLARIEQVPVLLVVTTRPGFALFAGGDRVIAGIAGFLLSLANAVQTWRRNRPIVSVHPGQHPTEAIEIEIENPSLRPITIIKSQCFPSELHQVWDPDRPLRAQIVASTYNEINRIIPGLAKQRFSFLRTKDGGFMLILFWQSNSAIVFSKVPLIVAMSGKSWERLRRAD